MDNHSRHPSLSLISSSPAEPVSTSPGFHRQSQSPFRYIHFPQQQEDDTQLLNITRERSTSPHRSPSPTGRPQNTVRLSSSTYLRPKASLPSGSLRHTRTRKLSTLHILKPWVPIILYILTSLVFVVAITLYKSELFAALDDLSHWLQSDGHYGSAILFLLIFLTTIPPVPLYSTLIVLSGYTFGAWNGAIISYFAALVGAVAVFIVSRAFFQDSISAWLSSAQTLNRVVRAIEKRPKLLFLIRLAPYPYNLLNCLLAASTSLSLPTYFICTALSLFKVIIHTSLGASIHSFKDYHLTVPTDPSQTTPEESDADFKARIWTIIGIILCVAIFIYITIIARRAVNDELEDSDDQEVDIGLLSASDDIEAGPATMTRQSPVMRESPFATQLSPMATADSSRCD